MRKDFIAARVSFHLDNMFIVNSDVVLQEADSISQPATPFCFDGVSQFLQKRNIFSVSFWCSLPEHPSALLCSGSKRLYYIAC